MKLHMANHCVTFQEEWGQTTMTCIVRARCGSLSRLATTANCPSRETSSTSAGTQIHMEADKPETSHNKHLTTGICQKFRRMWVISSTKNRMLPLLRSCPRNWIRCLFSAKLTWIRQRCGAWHNVEGFCFHASRATDSHCQVWLVV